MPAPPARAAVVVVRSMAEVILSVIIPTLNEGELSTPLLEQLQALRSQGGELIVVDGGSRDNRADRWSAQVDRVLMSEPGRGRQMNAGAALARGRLLWFLHLDSSLPVAATNELLALPEKSLWGFFPVRLSGQRWPFRMIAWAISWRSRLTQVATGDQGIFVSADLFRQLGGFIEQPLMEDVALSKTLRRLQKPRVATTAIETSSRRWEERGVWSTVLLMWSLRFAYWLGVSPQRLVRYYYG